MISLLTFDSWEQTVEQTERFSDTVAMAGQMKPDRSTGRANQRMREHGFQHRLSPCRKSIISIVPRVVSHRDSLRHHDDMWVSFEAKFHKAKSRGKSGGSKFRTAITRPYRWYRTRRVAQNAPFLPFLLNILKNHGVKNSSISLNFIVRIDTK